MEVQGVAAVATCHTAGCRMDGVPCECTVYPMGDPPTVSVVCAGCGQPVTDVVFEPDLNSTATAA
jgi:hypothetical protein